MNIIQRAREFAQGVHQLANRPSWEWRRCPRCGDTVTCKWGSYERHPWSLEGRKTVRVQRHQCNRCHRTYSEQSALFVRGSWYAREVHRSAIDHWQHVGSSLRRSAEVLRCWVGRQERWLLWRPLDETPEDGERCYLSASTVHRWLDRAGCEAQESVVGQLEGVPSSAHVITDGLWARLRGKTKKVVLAVVDSVSGLVWPPMVADGEEGADPWEKVFNRAEDAGLELSELRGVTSDGARGIISYLSHTLVWVDHQRCVFHLWRNIALASAVDKAIKGLSGEVVKAAGKQVRKELVMLIREVLDAASETEAWMALGKLRAHQYGESLAKALEENVEAALVHSRPFHQGLMRVSPEWCWRDFRLRLGRGRNHGSSERLERASLVWAIYRNFTPAQRRCERKRRYRRSGLSPLEVAGVDMRGISYRLGRLRSEDAAL